MHSYFNIGLLIFEIIIVFMQVLCCAKFVSVKGSDTTKSQQMLDPFAEKTEWPEDLNWKKEGFELNKDSSMKTFSLSCKLRACCQLQRSMTGKSDTLTPLVRVGSADVTSYKNKFCAKKCDFLLKAHGCDKAVLLQRHPESEEESDFPSFCVGYILKLARTKDFKSGTSSSVQSKNPQNIHTALLNPSSAYFRLAFCEFENTNRLSLDRRKLNHRVGDVAADLSFAEKKTASTQSLLRRKKRANKKDKKVKEDPAKDVTHAEEDSPESTLTETSDSHKNKTSHFLKEEGGKLENTNATMFSTRPLNLTEYRIQLEKEALRRQVYKEAQWAYICVVFISCLMLLSIWCMRGFHSRHANKREISIHDNSHQLLTVKEVMYRRARYLPMFRRDDGWEEVFVHDCGTDP